MSRFLPGLLSLYHLFCQFLWLYVAVVVGNIMFGCVGSARGVVLLRW
jgi:hypothetical protein